MAARRRGDSVRGRPLLALLVVGCVGESTPLDGLDVTEATLESVTVVYVGAMLGFEAGGANLAVTTVDGEHLDVPVVLSGPRVGVMAGVSVGTSVIDAPLVLPTDEGGFPGEALFGTYDGWQYAGELLVGFRYGSLFNESDVEIVLSMLQFGGEASIEYAWVTVAPSSDP